MALLQSAESRLLVDGKLVPGSAGTFATLNPATEETLGVAADAGPADIGLQPGCVWYLRICWVPSSHHRHRGEEASGRAKKRPTGKVTQCTNQSSVGEDSSP